MPDFTMFNEGKNRLGTSGLPATCYFLLSSQQITTGGLEATDTLAGGVGEITGTGYARQSQARPTPTNGAFAFSQMSWATGAATDWPASVVSIVLVTTADNTGTAICAWHLQTGGTARALNQANVTELVTPTYTVG